MTAATDTWPVDQLPAAIASWLPTRRWYAGKGRALSTVDVLRTTPLVDERALGGPLGVLAEVRVHFADGGEAHDYQLPLAFRPGRGSVPDHALIATTGGTTCADGLYDPRVVLAMLRLMVDGVDRGGLRLRADPRVAGQLAGTPRVRVLGVEQSNTSVVIGDGLILKVFRRLTDGPNPDLELHRALADAGSRDTATLLGAIEGAPPAPVTYAILHAFAANAVDGWALALTSVRDLVSGDAMAGQGIGGPALAGPALGGPALGGPALGGGRVAGQVRSTGGDLGPEAYRLGQSLARVHADLAAQLGTEQLGRVALADLAGELVDELGRAVAVVPELSRFEPQLRAAYARLPESASGLWVQRIHGDLHLGQALRTPLAWWLIDFEGEPVRSAAYRRLPRTPLRDVAGLLRSFDYAAHFDVDEAAPTPRRSRRVAEWLARNRHALSRGYASVAGTDPRAQQPLLRCLELGRAVYEATYEARNRPEWLPIPLRAMERLLGRSGGR